MTDTVMIIHHLVFLGQLS